jgi:MFS family permease
MIKKEQYGAAVKIAVALIICVQYTVTITTPILGTISSAYPQYLSYVKQLETMPTMAAVIISLLIGPLTRHFRKKQLLLVGIVLASAQFLPAVIANFWVLYFARLCAGFGLGFMFSFAASFPVDMFSEEDAAKMLGFRSFLGAIAGIVYQQCSARIATATGNYQTSFFLVLVLVPIFIYESVIMPKTCPVEEYNREMVQKPKESQPKEKRMMPLTWALLITMFVILLCSYTFMTNCAIVVSGARAQGGMGLNAAAAANILSVFTIAIALSGLLYPRLWLKLFKDYTTAVGVIFMTAGLLGIYTATGMGSMALVYGSTLIFGFGFEMNNSHLCQLLPRTSIASAATFLLAMMYAFINLGSWLAAYIVPAIANVFFPDALKGDWRIAIVGLALCAIVDLILCSAVKKNSNAQAAAK